MHEFLESLFHFRNESHERWFILSMILFGFSIIISGFSFIIGVVGRHTALTKPAKIITLALLRFMTIYHLSTVFFAFIAVMAKTKGDVYSIDCIWFNGLMGIVYILFLRLAKKNI